MYINIKSKQDKEQEQEFDFEVYLKNFKKIDKTKTLQNWIEVFISMSVHFSKLLPEKLIKTRRPNEEDNVFNYRMANYRPVTYGSINKSFDRLSRIISNINFTIQADEDIKEYIEAKNFKIEDTNEIHDLYTYVNKAVLKRMLEDPNGLLFWIYEQRDNTGKIMPIPKIVNSDKIYHFAKDYITILSEEIATFKNSKVTKPVYYCFTENAIYKFNENYNSTSFEFQELIVHNLGYIPFIILGGDLNAMGYYESFFAPYLAFGDEAIVQFSDTQAVMVQCGYPIKDELVVDCNNDRCVNGIDNKTNTTCKTCNGTGQVACQTPYGKYQRKLPNVLEGDKIQNFSVPSLRYISPDTNHLKISIDYWQTLIKFAEDALHLNFIDEAQSGTAKEIDREALYDMLTKIGNNIFDNIYKNSLKYIADYRNADSTNKSSIRIIKPSEYKLKTDSDLLAELKQFNDDNIPEMFKDELIGEIAQLRLSSNPVSIKIYSVISVYDKLFSKSINDKLTLFNSGGITKEEYIKSINAYPMIKIYINMISIQEFLKSDLTYDKIVIELDKLIQPFIDAYQQNKPIPLIPGMQ